MLSLIYTSIDNLVEWKDNPIKRAKLSDSDIRDGLTQFGFIDALDVQLTSDGKYLVIDGNRRLRIARDINLTSIPVIVHDADQNPIWLAFQLNMVGAKWDGQTAAQLIADYPECFVYLPKRIQPRIKGIMNVLGDDFKRYIREYSINTFDLAMQAASYVGRREEEEFCKRVAFWAGKYQVTRKLRLYLEEKSSPTILERLIEQNKPIKWGE